MKDTNPPVELSFLESIAVFGGLTGPSLDRVAAHLRRRQLSAGSCVVCEGDSAREMYVVEQGEVEVVVHRDETRDALDEGELILAVLQRGACFGEMSLLDIQPRSATVRTRTDATLLVLGYADLLAIQSADNEAFTFLVMNIAREVSRRLRLANKLLVSVMLSLHDGFRLTSEIFGGQASGLPN